MNRVSVDECQTQREVEAHWDGFVQGVMGTLIFAIVIIAAVIVLMW